MSKKSIVKATNIYFEDEFDANWKHERRTLSTACPYNPIMQNHDHEGKLGRFLTIEDGKGWWAKDLDDGVFQYLNYDTDDEQEIGQNDGLNHTHDEAQNIIDTHHNRYYR